MSTAMNPDMMTVRSVRWFGREVFEIALERDNLIFMPGDCLALFAADGRVSRPYSIASGIHDDTVRFVIRHMPGGVVSSFLSSRQPGDAVRVSPPFGWFRPGEHAEVRPFVFIATGTGIAPFLSFFRSFPEIKPLHCLYGVRNAADLIDPDWLREQGPVRIAVSREVVPGMFHGRVTGILETLTLPVEADYYLCGLDVMIDEVTIQLEQRGIEITRIHRECFFNASYYT
jgi:ferredoxin-NADP reductase